MHDFLLSLLKGITGKQQMVNYLLHNFYRLINSKQAVAVIGFLLGFSIHTNAFQNTINDSTTSTKQDAINYIEKITQLQTSAYWPSVKPQLFLQNIKDNINSPLNLYEGLNTNFCGYAALSYLVLHDDPLGYAKFMIKIYAEGKAKFGKASFQPSLNIRKAAGGLKFKGVLDIRPADQLWFLCLADHFKGYLNLFNHNFQPGDEDTFWAAVNYGKFNRMIRELLNYKVVARGTDLLRPWIHDTYTYLSKIIQTGITVMYVNNTILHKKNYNLVRAGVPTHYIVLLQISKTENGLINIVYWDYGFRTLRQLTPSFLKKITFGISHCTKKAGNYE
jgi:hypothetical protein